MAKVKYIKDKLLYEGKAKKIYSIEGQQFRNQVIMYFKDDATAFNAEKKSELPVRVNLIAGSVMYFYVQWNTWAYQHTIKKRLVAEKLLLTM